MTARQIGFCVGCEAKKAAVHSRINMSKEVHAKVAALRAIAVMTRYPLPGIINRLCQRCAEFVLAAKEADEEYNSRPEIRLQNDIRKVEEESEMHRRLGDLAIRKMGL